jgi:hypothetical protein
MPKATRKNTTSAKRAALDPIVKLIDAADEGLSQYRIAECDLMAAQEHFRSTTEDLERITKAMAKEKPTTQAGGMALLDYVWIRTAPSVKSIPCIREDANLHGLLSHARAVLRKSKPAA